MSKELENQLQLIKRKARKNGWKKGKHIFNYITVIDMFAFDNDEVFTKLGEEHNDN